MQKFMRIDERDNVAVALMPLAAGEEVFGTALPAPVPMGHKFAICDIAAGSNVVKYGYPIGHATENISKGQHVHTHNLKTNLKGQLEYTYSPKLSNSEKTKDGTFSGYLRADGQAGIRNEVWIVNTVGCVNKVSEKLAAAANEKYKGRTDGIFTFVHPFGCSQLGSDHAATQRILADMVNHPNAAAVLVLGLGCENNNIKEFKKALGDYDEKRVKFLTAQDHEDEIAAGLEILGELVEFAEQFKREPVNIDKLVIGLKCGGSDGFSGITANPLVGRISDIIVSYGGTSVLSEVPEMFGAETILMDRCKTPELFDNTVSLINDFKDYFIRYNQEVYENPSPGNKDGGISTLEDKSLGCTQKGGTTDVTAVLKYGERVHVKGLNLLEGPGNDIVAITALMAAGAHMVLFTTGRAAPVGAPVPTLKVSSNSGLAERKRSWIDFDAGALLAGESMESIADRFWKHIISVAEGKTLAKNEISGYREISIFKDGVTL